MAAVDVAVEIGGGVASLSSVVAAITAATAVGGSYVFATSDWLFNAQGQPLAYICQGVVPGQRPRVQRQPVDHQLGGVCPAVDRNIARVLLPLLRGAPAPERFHLPESGEVRLYDALSSAPLVWAGTPGDGDTAPALYSGAGFDPHAENVLLRPATLLDIRSVRKARDLKAGLDAAREATRQKQIDDAVVAAVERERADTQAREREAADQHARELAQREAAVREQTQREAALREQTQREAAAREQAQREATAREQTQQEAAVREQAQRDAIAREQAARSLQQQQAIEAARASQAAAEAAAARRTSAPDWRRFFRQHLNGADTLLVLTGESVDARAQSIVARAVIPGTPYYPSRLVVTDAFYEALEIDGILQGDLSSMRRVRWPPNLRHIVFVHVVGRAPDGSLQFRSMKTRLNWPQSALQSVQPHGGINHA